MGGAGHRGQRLGGMMLQFITLYVIWYLRYADRHSLRPLIKTLGTIILISLVGAAVGWGVRHEILKVHFGYGRLLTNLIVACVTTLGAGVIVFALYEITGIQKIREIVGRVIMRRSETA